MLTLDGLISAFDNGVRTLLAPAHSARPDPAGSVIEGELTLSERSLAAALMRVNHTGEICAQALYQGQALTARAPENRQALAQAALEEQDHLVWSAQRIEELGGRASLLGPLWYAGSLALGAVAGAVGDRWSLAFLAETERQVEAHLAGHLEQLPAADRKTRAVVEAMRADEAKHRDSALALGAAELPAAAKFGMRVMARVMTTVAHRF